MQVENERGQILESLFQNRNQLPPLCMLNTEVMVAVGFLDQRERYLFGIIGGSIHQNGHTGRMSVIIAINRDMEVTYMEPFPETVIETYIRSLDPRSLDPQDRRWDLTLAARQYLIYTNKARTISR